MSRSLPPLTWFRAFEAAARHLSFTAAAEEIGLTQSAVSQHVKSLESRLRVPLFQRRPRGLALTDDGRRLLPQVGAALGTLAEATRDFDAGPAESLLTIAASVSVIQWVIAPNLSSFAQAHPDVRIRFLSTIWPDDFATTRADVEIRFGSAAQVGKNAELLLPNHLIALKSPRLKGTITELPLIEAVGTSSGWKDWDFPGGATTAPWLSADSWGMALHLAAMGNGVALVSELLSGHAIASGLLTQAAPARLPSQEGYYLSVDQTSPKAIQFRRSFLNWISTQA